MDFQKIKEEVLKLKKQASKAGKDALNYSVSKLADSKFTLKTVEEVEAFLKTSKNTEGKDAKTWEKKVFVHRSIIIFTDISGEFFKEMLYLLPILETKAFSQNIKLKLADISMKWLHKTPYGIHETSSLVVFENEKVFKTIEGEEKIQKIVKSLSLDINTSIDEL
jgi:hypothetical protein